MFLHNVHVENVLYETATEDEKRRDLDEPTSGDVDIGTLEIPNREHVYELTSTHTYDVPNNKLSATYSTLGPSEKMVIRLNMLLINVLSCCY